MPSILGGTDTAVTGDDPVILVHQNRTYEAELLNARGNLLYLFGAVGAGIA